VTNKNKKRPSGYRTPAAARQSQPARKGILGSLFAPRVPGTSSMPKIPTSLARGVATVASSPMVVVTTIVVVVAEWLVLVAFGSQGPVAIMVNQLGIPPVGSYTDLTLAIGVFGVQTGFLALLGFIVIRAVVLALLTSMVVDVLQTGSASRWSLMRALRILPIALTVNIGCLGLLVVANFIGPLLGSGFGLLILMTALVGGVYLLGFATTIAATERRGLAETMGRSARAGRTPGAGNLTFAAIYVLTAVTVLAIPKPGSLVGVNPSIAAWAIVLVTGLGHAVVIATLAFRYISVADEVPDAPARPQPKTRGRAR
jgi:hypothetical protein